MTDLSPLIDALQRAKGPSRELDLAIASALVSDVVVLLSDSECSNFASTYWNWKYTASIDASIALLELVLPAANCWGVERDHRGFSAYCSRNNVSKGHWLIEAVHPSSPAIALLLAILQAKQVHP
jgi:hypothetical protein